MSIFKKTIGEGEDIVLLHGWGCDHRYMEPLVDQLSDHYRVSNYDLPGRGQSTWDPSIKTIHDIADRLLTDLPEQAIYIGWSFGGLLTTSIASRFPERVKRYIGLCTIPKFISSEDWPAVPQPGFKAPFEQGIREQGLHGFLKYYYDLEYEDFDPKPATYHKLLELLETTTLTHRANDMDVLFKGIDICDAADLRDEFSALRCPVDLILGDKDDSVPSTIHEHITKLNSDVNMHIIPGAHHMPFWTHQDVFNKILGSLLNT